MDKCEEKNKNEKQGENHEEALSEKEIKFLNLISEIIINASIRQYNEKKSD